jgi:hypothetical protein
VVAALPASPLHGVGAHDDRDWAAIRAWVATLPGLLRGAGAAADWRRLSAERLHRCHRDLDVCSGS